MSYNPDDVTWQSQPLVPPPPPEYAGLPPYSPAQLSIKPYSNTVFCILFLLNIIFYICAFFKGGISHFGTSGISASIIAFCIMDWKGFISLHGWVTWKQFSKRKKFWLSCLFLCLVPIAFIAYLWRCTNTFAEERKQKMPKVAYRKGRPAIAVTVGVIAFVVTLASVSGNASSDSTTTASLPTQQIATAMPISRHTATLKPTLTPAPTPEPAATPTPTSEPVQQPPPPTTAPPTGVNGNPWGYDFNPGSYITDPPADFCTHFDCIASFWSGRGHVEECNDTTYSKSGGLSGSCSRHGGDLRPLYQHP